MRVGVVKELWRYPVKSMGGERLDAVTVGGDGVVGDRAYAVRDERAGEIRGAKNIPGLLHCSAHYLEPGDARPGAPAAVTFPDGVTVRTDAPDISARLSATLGLPVTLWPRQPASNREHYRRAQPPGEIRELRRVFGLDDDDPLPSFDRVPPELFEYVAPLGTYFDAFPLHLLTTATIASLAAHHPDGRFDVRRFRPNVLIELTQAAPGFPEEEWCDAPLRIGEVEAQVTMPAMRCVMTASPQSELAKDPLILRTIVKKNHSNAGVYATIARTGRIRLGDAVEMG